METPADEVRRPPQETLTVAQLSRRVSVPPAELWRWWCVGCGPPALPGAGAPRWRADDVELWLARYGLEPAA